MANRRSGDRRFWGKKKSSRENIERTGDVMKWLWAALLTSAGIVSAQAFTCADVRALSLEQRAYYIKVFNITSAQQDRIRRECSKPGAEGPSHFGHRERDASATSNDAER
jgi:hypothetical protein